MSIASSLNDAMRAERHLDLSGPKYRAVGHLYCTASRTCHSIRSLAFAVDVAVAAWREGGGGRQSGTVCGCGARQCTGASDKSGHVTSTLLRRDRLQIQIQICNPRRSPWSSPTAIPGRRGARGPDRPDRVWKRANALWYCTVQPYVKPRHSSIINDHCSLIIHINVLSIARLFMLAVGAAIATRKVVHEPPTQIALRCDAGSMGWIGAIGESESCDGCAAPPRRVVSPLMAPLVSPGASGSGIFQC
jgi:hypothetical protein